MNSIWNKALNRIIRSIGDPIFYTRNGVSTPLIGVFQDAYVSVSDLGQTITSDSPICGIQLSALPVYPKNGDIIMRGDRQYRVSDCQRDGVAGALLFLQEIDTLILASIPVTSTVTASLLVGTPFTQVNASSIATIRGTLQSINNL